MSGKAPDTPDDGQPCYLRFADRAPIPVTFAEGSRVMSLGMDAAETTVLDIHGGEHRVKPADLLPMWRPFYKRLEG